MANDTLITLSKGGIKEQQLSISQVIIPDLWHISEALRKQSKITNGPESAELILKCWNISHSLKRHIKES